MVGIFLVPALAHFRAAGSDPRLPRLAAYGFAILPVAVVIFMTAISVVAIVQLIATLVSPNRRVAPGAAARQGVSALRLGPWLLLPAFAAAAVYVFAAARPVAPAKLHATPSDQQIIPIHHPLHLLEGPQ